jgi:hypothetical protein
MLNMFNVLGVRLEPELEEKLESLAKDGPKQELLPS